MTSIAAIDPPVDLAVIVIRPDAILDAVREAADRGITNLLILPGGFAEAGPIGVQRNEELLKLAAARGLTVAGPNCGRCDRRLLRFLRHRPGREPAPGLGSRALILSNSGGPGVLCADRASLEGLHLGALPTAFAEVLRQQLPPEASVANPIDLLAGAREDRFGFAFEAAMAHAASAYDTIVMIHVVPFMVDAAPVIARLAKLAAESRTPLLHSMMGTLPGKAEWFAAMESAGVPMFNDVEEMAEAAGLLARYARLRDGDRSDNLSDVRFRDRCGA